MTQPAEADLKWEQRCESIAECLCRHSFSRTRRYGSPSGAGTARWSLGGKISEKDALSPCAELADRDSSRSASGAPVVDNLSSYPHMPTVGSSISRVGKYRR